MNINNHWVYLKIQSRNYILPIFQTAIKRGLYYVIVIVVQSLSNFAVLSCIMDTHYLSISDILVSNEKVPSKFLQDLPKMGFLDPSSTEDDLKAGSNVEIPIWLAESLQSRRQQLINVELPKIYKDAYREILNADACTVDMHKLSQYFYEFGCYIAKYDIRGDVSSTLINAFTQRFRLLLEASLSHDSVSAVLTLSSSERQRALAATNTEHALSEWLHTGDCKLTTANMVANHRKRKRAEMEML